MAHLNEWWDSLSDNEQAVAILVVTFVLAGLIWAWGSWLERKASREFLHRLRTDPEFARQHHEMCKYDDWEDQGYFDGR